MFNTLCLYKNIQWLLFLTNCYPLCLLSAHIGGFRIFDIVTNFVPEGSTKVRGEYHLLVPTTYYCSTSTAVNVLRKLLSAKKTTFLQNILNYFEAYHTGSSLCQGVKYCKIDSVEISCEGLGLNLSICAGIAQLRVVDSHTIRIYPITQNNLIVDI